MKLPQWVFNLLIGAVLFAYGYIFNSITERIENVENKQLQIEYELKPAISEIRETMMEMKTDLKWIKNEK